MSSSFWDNLPSRSPIVISLQVSANHFDSGWVSNSLFSLVTTAKTLIRNCCIPGKGELQRHWGKQELAARGKDKTYFQYIAQISKVQRDLAAQQEGFKYLSFLYARRRSKGRFRAANKRVEISSEKGPSRFFLSRFPVVRPMVFFFTDAWRAVIDLIRLVEQTLRIFLSYFLRLNRIISSLLSHATCTCPVLDPSEPAKLYSHLLLFAIQGNTKVSAFPKLDRQVVEFWKSKPFSIFFSHVRVGRYWAICASESDASVIR